jgi:hypothetical protein
MNTLSQMHSQAIPSPDEVSKPFPVKWVGIVFGISALAVAAVTVFNISISTLVIGAFLLACPLMHIFMMRGGNHKH